MSIILDRPLILIIDQKLVYNMDILNIHTTRTTLQV